MAETALERLRDSGAEIAIVLGSGLNALVEEVAAEERVLYSEFADLSAATVPGHNGQFIRAAINKVPVIFAQGRVHLYEGYSAQAVTGVIRLLASCGIKRVILTNAAGSLNESFPPGSWMMICDHLNLTGTTPLIGGGQFVDLTDAYSRTWRARFADAADAAGIALHEGVYAGLSGPQYETPAEVRMLRNLGADAVGMSTVLETIQARALGLEVAAFSCLTNWAAAVGNDELSHDAVLASGQAAAAEFSRLLEGAVAH